jgi:hypothetical protein
MCHAGDGPQSLANSLERIEKSRSARNAFSQVDGAGFTGTSIW